MCSELAPELKSLADRVQSGSVESPPAPRAPWESLALTYAFAYGAGGAISEVLDHVRGQSNVLQSAIEVAGAGSLSSAWDALFELYSGFYGAACLLLGWLAWRKRVSCLIMARWLSVLLIGHCLGWSGRLVANYERDFSQMAIQDRMWITISVVASLLTPCITLWVLSRLPHGITRPARCIIGVSLILGGLDGIAWILCNAGTLNGVGIFPAASLSLDDVPLMVEGPVMLFLGIGVFRWRSVRHLAGLVLLLGLASHVASWRFGYASGGSLFSRAGWIVFASAMCGYYLPPAIVAWRFRSILSREDAWASGEPRCRVCEYNLTGNLSGICPECGTTVHQDRPAPPSQSTTAART